MQMTLKAARVNKGLTQEDVAKAIKVSKKTVWAWENGKSSPRLSKIDPLCELLGLSYDNIRWEN